MSIPPIQFSVPPPPIGVPPPTSSTYFRVPPPSLPPNTLLPHVQRHPLPMDLSVPPPPRPNLHSVPPPIINNGYYHHNTYMNMKLEEYNGRSNHIGQYNDVHTSSANGVYYSSDKYESNNYKYSSNSHQENQHGAHNRSLHNYREKPKCESEQRIASRYGEGRLRSPTKHEMRHSSKYKTPSPNRHRHRSRSRHKYRSPVRHSRSPSNHRKRLRGHRSPSKDFRNYRSGQSHHSSPSRHNHHLSTSRSHFSSSSRSLRSPSKDINCSPSRERSPLDEYKQTTQDKSHAQSLTSHRSPSKEGHQSPIRETHYSLNRQSHHSTSRRNYSPSRRIHLSPSQKKHCSPSRQSHRSRSKENHRSPSGKDQSSSSSRYNHRSPSRHSHRSPSRNSHRSPSRHSHRSPSRYSHRSPSRYSHRSPSRYSHRSPSRFTNRSPSRFRYRSPSSYCVGSTSTFSPGRESNKNKESSPKSHGGTKKPMSDRDKILDKYRKNYCHTSTEILKKMEEWSRDHNSEDESENTWYRSSPADLYYKPTKDRSGVQQTAKLEKICDQFVNKLIERGRCARPAVDELPPLKPMQPKPCKHRLDCENSDSSDDSLDEEGLADRVMLELQRKQCHPRRLHPEMWFNNTGEMNGGPLCRCSARARRHGMRHGVYAGETLPPRCIITESNLNKLYHYRITVSPPTNFLIKTPTIIPYDEHEFLFSGFSMFSHYKLSKLPSCKVIRFNIEYTILYIEEPPPTNFTIQELDLFEEYLFSELLELVDLDLGKATDTTCSQFHFMPRFIRNLSEGGCEVLSMCEVLKYLIDQSSFLIPPDMLERIHKMDHYTWQRFVDDIKGMIVTYPGKKPCSVRVDQIDRSPPNAEGNSYTSKDKFLYYPEIVHFGIRPPQLSYAGNPEYQKAWRLYVKYRHLVANMAKPTFTERNKLASKEAKLQEMRTQTKMKRDVTVAISSEGFYTTGLMCDVVQHAMLIPVLIRHLRFHKSLDSLEEKIGYTFKSRALLQTALTHPSYRENFGTNPDHARNSLTNCGIRQPEYGDRRIHYTRKKGIVTLINIMSRFGKRDETESNIKHNERLEFLGDAVVEFLSSIHLFKMFPVLSEGGLATYRAAIVQNQHLGILAKNIGLDQYMLYAHGSDLCREVVMRHAMANCFEALMGALFLDGGIEVADKAFSLALWFHERDMLEAWVKDRPHQLQEQEPLGDRKYIKDFEFLKKLTEFENSIGVQFTHIRLLARAFTDRSVGFTHLTLGSNQRLEFLGDTVLQLIVSDRLYRYFPEHHEGHLSLLRSSLVNNRTQALICDDLDMLTYAVYNNPKSKPTAKKHKADLLEAFLGALYIDKNMEYCQAFCSACLFPRLQEFIMNQDWNDPKSKLQQCCLTLRSMDGGEPDIPVYKVIECLGPTNTRVYAVAVYFRGVRLAAARGHSIQEAEMNAAEAALGCAQDLFPQLDHQKRVMAKYMRKRKQKGLIKPSSEETTSFSKEYIANKVPKAYRDTPRSDSSGDEGPLELTSEEDEKDETDDSNQEEADNPSDTDSEIGENLSNVEVTSLLSDMERLKEEMIKTNTYDKLKQKHQQSDSDED